MRDQLTCQVAFGIRPRWPRLTQLRH